MLENFDYRWKRMLAFFGWRLNDVAEITGLNPATIRHYAHFKNKNLNDSIKAFERCTKEGTLKLSPPFEKPKYSNNPGLHRLEEAIKHVINERVRSNNKV